MAKPTRDEIDRFVVAAREANRIRERDGWRNPTQCTVIVALADECDELLALLQRWTYLIETGAPSLKIETLALLAKYAKGTP